MLGISLSELDYKSPEITLEASGKLKKKVLRKAPAAVQCPPHKSEVTGLLVRSRND